MVSSHDFELHLLRLNALKLICIFFGYAFSVKPKKNKKKRKKNQNQNEVSNSSQLRMNVVNVCNL